MGGGEQYFLRKGKYLLNLQSLLRYGVTVALQILVLSVQVRILVSQLFVRGFPGWEAANDVWIPDQVGDDVSMTVMTSV